MRQTRAVPIWALLALGAAVPLAGQDRIEERRPLQPNATVDVRAESHEIRVEAWDRNEIEVRGAYDADRERFEIRGGERNLVIQVQSERGRGGEGRSGSRTLTVRVPAGVRLEAASVSGRVHVSGLRGQVTAKSVSGAVSAEGVEADLVDLGTVSGAITFSGRARDLRAQSVSGAVRLGGQASDISGKTVSGRVEVQGSPSAARVELSSVSGRVHFSGGLAERGELRAESHSGGVELELPSRVDARFRLSTFSGSVNAELAGMQEVDRRTSRYTPEESMTFVIGRGAGRIEAHSFSGSVRVRQVR